MRLARFLLRVRTSAALMLAAAATTAADPNKIFRYAFPSRDHSLDPQKISDLYSNILNSAMFDAPIKYDFLARPLKLKPSTLAAMPEISADGLTYTLRVKPGIFFAEPRLPGQAARARGRGLLSTMKRLMDPKLAAPLLAEIRGSSPAATRRSRRRARTLRLRRAHRGLEVLDRYTFGSAGSPSPTVFICNVADCRVSCAVARKWWKPTSDVGSLQWARGPTASPSGSAPQMVFEADPGFREGDVRRRARAGRREGGRSSRSSAASPAAGGQGGGLHRRGGAAALARLPQRDLTSSSSVAGFSNVAFPNNRLAPNLRKRDIRMAQVPGLDLTFAYFNMEDPLVGGYTPEKVALRRAISLGYNTRDEIAIVRKGQAIPAHAPYSPGVAGHDPNFRTSASEYSIPRARALLDMFGYMDRNGDGYRERPTAARSCSGSPPCPAPATRRSTNSGSAAWTTWGSGSRSEGKWPDLLKEALRGKLMIWRLGGAASAARRGYWLSSLYGPNSGFKGNFARFKLDATRLYERGRVMPDSPERTKVYQQMAGIMVACPTEGEYSSHPHGHVVSGLLGYRRPAVQSNSFWKYIDIDVAKPPPPPAERSAPIDPIAHLALAALVFLATHFVTSTPVRKPGGAIGEK
ncbi:MAG: hypothetical protein IPH30_16910, partial [Betaproteobacteria bacterium]|nr:hypothetical protein [Betaproteobacteria bacterium]